MQTVPNQLLATVQRSHGQWWVVLATFPNNASERRLWCQDGVIRPHGVRCIPYEHECDAHAFAQYWKGSNV